MLYHRSFRLAVEGNIGVGKTTFLRLLGERLGASVVYEPHQRWQMVGSENLLDRFYHDPHRWAYAFQLYVITTRLEEQHRQSANGLVLYERSLDSDFIFAQNCFESGWMSGIEWDMYRTSHQFLRSLSVDLAPQVFIYLRAEPEVCYQRMMKRCRSEEAAVPLAYITKIHEQHEQWLCSTRTMNTPVLVLDGTSEFENDPAMVERHAHTISRFIEEYYVQLTDKQSGMIAHTAKTI